MTINQSRSTLSQARKLTGLVLIFAFLIGLVYSNQPAVAASTIISNAAKSPVPMNSTRKASPINITVIALPGLASVNITKIPSVLSCLTTADKSAANLVQDQGGINLNQPANCFSLESVTQAVAIQNLKVQSLNQTAKITIAYNKELLQSPNFMPSPLGPLGLPSLPALPILLAASALVFRKKIAAKLLSLKNQHHKEFNLSQLQVLRC